MLLPVCRYCQIAGALSMSVHSGKSRASSATSRVEELMRVESRLSSIDRPPMQDGETKGQYAWRLIRQCVRFAIDSSLKADAKELNVVHGLHHGRRLNHTQPILQMLYNKVRKVNYLCRTRIFLNDVKF